ncbi:receptor-type tyrosine-protein phosphatase H isoform X2 [Tachysurus fulvidraco]|uniref:receptor-type tyrosine-protein phosphatase H isoform X2 n=1 Tax=Tachysurus fulvidraco TaxID=1234273 RepID=UPI001FF0179E|nr:receptor-type tyrosine-protein phosphatase H isoform X2 [Tachysurus fulvidraco]
MRRILVLLSLCRFVWGNSTSFPTTVVTVTTTTKTTELSTPQTLSNVESVSIINRTERTLKLQWNKVDNKNYNYTLTYDSQNISISGSVDGSVVTYTVENLAAGTKYKFTLYTTSGRLQSSGFSFPAVTIPNNVKKISVKNRSETELILEWDKVNNNSNYTYTLCYNNQNISINGLEGGSAVSYTVPDLDDGTEYTFILYTVYEGVQSTGYIFKSVTTPLSVTNVYVNSYNETSVILKWDKVDNNNIYNYTLSYNSKNISLSGSEGGSVVTYTVTDLTAGTAYIFTLYTVFNGVESRGYNITSHTIPNGVTGLHCQYSSGGYGLTLVWDPPNGGRTAVQVNMSSTSFSHTGERLKIDGLMPAQWYTFTVSAFSGSMQSVSVSITCQTDPRGVIAGVLTSLLLVILILCIGIFIRHHKSKTSSKSKLSSNEYKPIPLKNFPGHFSAMSCDENRGFIEEYEDLSTVGTDQSCKIATLPVNKDKNRFSNVQAYDSSRVKLAELPGSDSDYINANYIHGYGKKKKQYIAAQGPLPSTVNDFWRMVWEQKSSAIVMLTNCTEGGKIKCEHYWPMDNMPCLYGNLLVTIQSEQKESCWTQREFTIRNESTSEEHAVTHFHFTAWPDHGVPNRTEELIQFRWIVRKHIETFPFSGPTVVHCSAGVGRTGTLIALDLLLQQMDKEELVNIADCVHGMRLSRPLMVQTQSQYVFLHQCVMESLQPKEESIPEPIYENSEMIIPNALALQEYKASNKRV